MPAPNVKPYGSWTSPITADLIAAGSMGLSEVQIDGGDIYWLEMRPNEGGRSVVVRRNADGRIEDCIPSGFNARTRVHEYGGGSYCVAGGDVVFDNFSDQRLYRVSRGETPLPVGPGGPLRCADLSYDPHRRRILCVCEDHSRPDEPLNTIISIPLTRDCAQEVVAAGRGFYSAPRLSPDGASIAYLAWDHPYMPWDAAELWLSTMDEDGRPLGTAKIAGGGGESVLEPMWSPGGLLHFVSDRTQWWNIYRRSGQGDQALHSRNAEFASPPWVFGLKHFAFISEERIICAFTENGAWSLAELDAVNGRLSPVALPFSEFGSVHSDGARNIVFLAGSPTHPLSVVRLDLIAGKRDVLRSSITLDLDDAFLSKPEPVDFPSAGGFIAHGLFYPPSHPHTVGPADEKPPLVVMIHGGPTSATSTVLRLGIQYYSSRGIAILDVNYSGSTGYGRDYRNRLAGNWGIADVDDCCAGAMFLARQGRVDSRRLAIRGGSAGGYTTLACLAFRKVFAAGASHYGVSDCEILARDTHKFESRYLDTLIGPYPERRDLYLARSPLHHLDGLDRPVIFFQGLDDKVVPPAQAEMMYEALRKRGVPTAYVPFEGEQHGFRQAANIRRALEGELYFFSRVFGFTPADPIPPIAIENL